MKKNEFYFSSQNNTTKICTEEWLPEGEPKAVLQIFHGAAGQEHCCKELAEYFNRHGFVVIGNKKINYSEYHCEQDVMHACLTAVKEKYPDVPYVLLGLSQGASTVHAYLCKHPGAVEGVVLADTEQEPQHIQEDIPVLQISGVKENRPEAFQYIYRWTAERLDEMLYRAATKH